MLKEGSVIAVAGARRLLLVIVALFWLLISAISFLVVAYKALGIGLTATMTTFGPFEGGDATGPFYAIATVMIVVFFWLMIFSWRQVKSINAALQAPLDEEMQRAANVVSSVQQSVKNSSVSLVESARKAIDNRQRDDGEP